MRPTTIVLSLILILVSIGCSSAPMKIATLPVQPHEEVIGPASGHSIGIMLFQFIPIGQNTRFQKAYDEALGSTGATRLVDITIQERWFWAWVLNGYSFTVKGTAVRGKASP